VKSGRTKFGARAASSHTASAASPDIAIDALFRQAGVIRVDTLEELFNVTLVLSHQPLPVGNRLAIVGNSGGPGILAADACLVAGLELAELSPETTQTLQGFLPSDASVNNPVDMIASATPEQYERAVRVVLDDPNVDSVLVIFTPPLVTRPADVACAIASATDGATKPVVANFLGGETTPGVVHGTEDAVRPIPSFPFPEPAVHALGRVTAHARWRRRPEGTPADLSGIDIPRARAVVERALADGPEGAWLGASAVIELLSALQIPVLPSRHAISAADAAEIAEDIGFPVALKAAGGAIVHKTEVGGVQLGLTGADQVAAAFAAMGDRLGSDFGGALVQPMAAPGVETIVGVVHEPSFGPLLMFGLGGVATDLLGDRAFRILPLTVEDAHELIRSVRSSPLLFGYRGAPKANTDALIDVLLRVSALAEIIPELAELDLNPLVVSADGAVVLDAKARIAPTPTGPGPLQRKLR
jgi:acyl-CoA synthetase (NDP forming)